MFDNICRQTPENLSELSKNRKIALFFSGGGNRDVVEKCISSYDNIDCIIDNDSELWGLSYKNIKIYPVEHLYALSPETHLVLVASGSTALYSATRAIKAVDDFKVFYFSAVSDKFFGYFSNVLYDNLDKIKEVEKSLEDDRSKKVYREVIYRRIMGATGEFKSLKTIADPQYIFSRMFTQLSDNEIFIDCGGYIGDSVEKFVSAFGNKVKKIYSFECVEENIAKISEVGASLHKNGWCGELVIAPYAVSDKNAKTTFNDTGKADGGYIPETRLTTDYNDKLAPVQTFEIETKKIDDFVQQDERITLIKMDIEGAEYSALKGAEKTIRKYKPRLAISIYHNPSDYWRIKELISEFSSDYKFAVRHHGNNHLDTVLYAWEEV